MLSILSGHKRYAHIAALRCDNVLPELLGMNKIVSEDAVRRAFAAVDEDEGAVWLRRHLDYCTSPLLAEPWILDIDTTVKPLYGHQEGAVVGYNPKKPGLAEPLLSDLLDGWHTAGIRCPCRPRKSAYIQTFCARPAGAALSYFRRHLWLALSAWPLWVRGRSRSCAKRNSAARPIPFQSRFGRLRQAHYSNLSLRKGSGTNAGQGPQAEESLLRLHGPPSECCVIILRRRVKGALTMSLNETSGQKTLSFVVVGADADVDEHSVLGHFVRRGARESFG